MSANADKKNMNIDVEENEEENKLVDEMRSKFIIPNWYKPNHFEQMKGWDEEKVERFKDYLMKCVCSYDEIKEYVEEVLENFIGDDEDEDDNNKSANDNKKDMKNDIVGVECYKCKQPPFGAYKRGDWCLYLHSKCAYCGQENAVDWKRASNEE